MSEALAPAGSVIRAIGLHKRFHEGALDVQVLQGVDLDIAAGETVAIVGASGSGKSTLLHLMGGLEAPTQGQVLLMGRDLMGMDAQAQGVWRNRHLGFVYQFHHLLPEFSAEENVMLPLRIAGERPGRARDRARAALAEVGLIERAEHRPAELSGGEAQRVAVARALVAGPELVLADEPSGNLDARSAGQLHELIATLARERRCAFVVVTHNDRLAGMADRVLTLEGGRLRPAN